MAPKFSVNIHHDAADIHQAPISFSGAGSNQIIAGLSGTILRIYKIFFIVNASTNITYQDGANSISGPLAFSANEGMVLDFDTKPWFTCTPGNAFNLNSSVGVQVGGTVYYTQDA